jgi:hypothetical protein|tara:strand:+ start:753 stop:1394 length:642 start_codon:yes stop_codon:yes gene_type:complete
MASRKQIAERILRILQGGDITTDTDIDIREIMLHVDSERDNMVQEKLVQSYKGLRQITSQDFAGHSVLGSYVSEKSYGTSMDIPRKQKSITLDTTPIDLPDEAGILYVKDAGDLSKTYAKLSAGTEAMYASMPSFKAANKDYYVSIGSRLFFGGENAPKKAIVGLIAMSASLGDDDLYPLSPGDEQGIVKSVVELYNLMNAVKQDFINDNIDQ